jgi:hypothetical protein
MGANARGQRRGLAIPAWEATDASFAAGPLPRLPEAANGDAIRTAEHGLLGALPLNASSQQMVERIRHEYFPPFVVPGRAWGQADDALHQVNLLNLHSC